MAYLFILSLGFLIYFFTIEPTDQVINTFFFIIVLSLFFLMFGDHNPFSLYKTFYLFTLIFFGITPWIHYTNSIIFWGGITFTKDMYLLGNFLIIIILFGYHFLYHYSLLFATRLRIKRKKTTNYKIDNTLLLVLSCFSFLLTLYFTDFNLPNLLFRSLGEAGSIDVTTPVSLIFTRFIRPIPVTVLLMYRFQKKRNKFVEFFLLIIALLSNFPFSNARFFIAALYIAILISYLPKIFSIKHFLTFTLLIGFLFIFPYLNQFRSVSEFTNFSLTLSLRMFNDAHFDSYQSLLRVIETNTITFGRQLVGVFLFFVPRSIWIEKPFGSGYLIAVENNFFFRNISMNFFGEGFINFGFFGVLLFLIVISFITSYLDYKFWKYKNKNVLIFTIYVYSIGMFFFLLRGDLLSSFAYSIGLFLSPIIIYLFGKRKIYEF